MVYRCPVLTFTNFNFRKFSGRKTGVCGEDLKELSGLLWRRQENVVTGYVYAKRYNFDNIVVQSPLFRAKTGVGVGDRFQDIWYLSGNYALAPDISVWNLKKNNHSVRQTEGADYSALFFT